MRMAAEAPVAATAPTATRTDRLHGKVAAPDAFELPDPARPSGVFGKIRSIVRLDLFRAHEQCDDEENGTENERKNVEVDHHGRLAFG